MEESKNSPTTDSTPAAPLVRWHKKPYLKDLWEAKVQLADGTDISLSVFGVSLEQNIESLKLLETAQDVKDTLHLWREDIIQDILSISTDFKNVRDVTLRESLTLVNILFDHETKLSAIYFNTTCLSGHQVVVEFNDAGEPYEAEITG